MIDEDRDDRKRRGTRQADWGATVKRELDLVSRNDKIRGMYSFSNGFVTL